MIFELSNIQFTFRKTKATKNIERNHMHTKFLFPRSQEGINVTTLQSRVLPKKKENAGINVVPKDEDIEVNTNYLH